jgi:hypothetical protein
MKTHPLRRKKNQLRTIQILAVATNINLSKLEIYYQVFRHYLMNIFFEDFVVALHQWNYFAPRS